MKISCWYHVDEQLPAATGFYLVYEGVSLGNDETSVKYAHWNGSSAHLCDWTVFKYHGASVNARFWTDINLDDMYIGEYETYVSRKETPSEKIAREEVESAVRRYELIKVLTK